MDGFSNTARKDCHVLDDPTISVVVGGRHYLQEVRVLAALTWGKAKGKKKKKKMRLGPVLLYPAKPTYLRAWSAQFRRAAQRQRALWGRRTTRGCGGSR